MKRSELTDICNKIIELHIEDLQNEFKAIFNAAEQKQTSLESMTFIMASAFANSIAHSVQATTDVLVNVGLLDVEDD